MLNMIKKNGIKLSLVAALAVVPSAVQGASGGGMVEGSSESTSAIIEPANFEAQLNRINVGINLVRINTDILENMPVSVDSQWVDKVLAPLNTNELESLDDIKNDGYFSTVQYTNAILGRPGIRLSPLNYRLYHIASVIYKNDLNGYNAKIENQEDKFRLPNMNVFPDITDTKTYVTFKEDDKVALIDVAAESGNLYPNVEMATISLAPEDLQEEIIKAKDEYKESLRVYGDKESELKSIEAWLDDDKNAQSPEIAEKEAQVPTLKAEVEAAEKDADTKQEIYYQLIDEAALAIESNFDETKVPLARKLEKLLDTVDNNAFGAASMFTAATAGIYKGLGMASDEIQAIAQAKAVVMGLNITAKQKEELQDRLNDRYERMATGTLLAIPNIGIGLYYSAKQASLAGVYQKIVNKVIEGAEAAEEAQKAKEEADAKAAAEANKEA